MNISSNLLKAILVDSIKISANSDKISINSQADTFKIEQKYKTYAMHTKTGVVI